MLQEIINLITTPPGNLTYYLVVAFSILGAWGLLLYRRGQGRLVEDKRAMIALTGVILLWMLMSVLAGLSWQGLIDERLVMPPLDSSTTLLSVILIAWIWVFPRPSSVAMHWCGCSAWRLSLSPCGA